MKQTLFFLTVWLAAACSGGQPQSDERTITVSIEPIRYLTELVAGEKYKVVSMVPGGNSPETYDPTPRQLVGLSGSEAYFCIGYIGFEQTWMQRMAASAPAMKLFDLSEGISLIRETGHGHEGGVEPHLWSSPANARFIVRNVCRALCSLDPVNRAYYEQNLKTAEQKIEETDWEIRLLLAGKHDQAFLIYHPALSYYARDYGLRQLSIEENGKEPSAAHLKALTDLCKQENIRVVFVQKEFDTRNASGIAAETGAQIVSVNPLSYEWKKELIEITQTLCHE